MKTLTLVFLLSTVFCSVYASIWHVNNDQSVYADFNQVSAAVASPNVQNGDTLYVYGSTSTYSDTNVTKTLTIIGPGFFLESNPGLQHTALSVTISNLTISAPNCVVAGIRFSSWLYVNATGSALIGCYTIYTRINSTSNCLFQGCYFVPIAGYGAPSVGLSSATNIIFSNCIFGFNNGYSAIDVPTNSSSIVHNSVIRGTVNINNTEFYNNIIYKHPSYPLNWTASANVHHNVFVHTPGFDWGTVIGGATNVLNYDGPLFIASASPDGMYQLVDDPENLALTAGNMNDECGIFGGLSPYKLSGIPAIPTIYEISVPSVGSILPIRVKARSNN